MAVVPTSAGLVRREGRCTPKATVAQLVGPAPAVGVGMSPGTGPIGLAVVVVASSIPRFGGTSLMEFGRH